MNKIIILSLILFLVTIHIASATPVISNINISPSSNLWLRPDKNATTENATINLNCHDDEGKAISRVYANITGPVVLTPNGPWDFICINNNCSYLIDSVYLDRIGTYNVNIACENNESNYTPDYTNFTVSKLTGYVNPISPNPTYYQGITEIDFIVQKNNDKISSNVNFNVSLDNVLRNLSASPTYDDSRDWVLKIDSPPSSGIHNIKITAFYDDDRTNVTNYSSIEYIDFGIESVNENGIQSNDNLTVTLRALEWGKIIDFNMIKSNLNMMINSNLVTINNIIQKPGNLFDTFITAPSLPPGIYTLIAYLNYNGNYYSDNTSLNYVIPVSGTIVDDNNKALNTQIKFIKGGSTQRCGTDSYGYYSDSSCRIYLVPDYYDVGINFPNSVVYLSNLYINSFDDPIKYVYHDDFDVPGIRNAGLHDFKIDLSYSSIQIEMSYNEKNVVNENNLKIFECSSWNRGKKICNSNWNEVYGEIDTTRNKARLNSSTSGPLYSAFIIGETKNINVDFSLDKNAYNPGDNIKIRGLVKDEDGNSVVNATIEIKVKNTQISSTVITDENGIFSLEIPTPQDEGNYDLTLKATSNPYGGFDGDKKFAVTKSKSIFIDFPDTVRIAIGENLTERLNIVNNGQADVNNLKIYLDGVPEGYYNFSENTDLKAGEKKSFDVNFSIPYYAVKGISSATIKIDGNNISQEKVFGLNIVERNESSNQTLPTTGLASGFTLPEINYLDVAFIILFAAVCFSAAIILKKRKIVKSERSKITGFLFDVRNFIGKDEVRHQEKNDKSIYDKLILTEFPNFLNFSKKLNRSGENGKND